MKFWKKNSSFCTRKRVVIKLLKFLNCIDSSCLGYCNLEVAGRLQEEIKKKLLKKFFFWILQYVKQEKKFIMNFEVLLKNEKKKKNIYIYIYIYIHFFFVVFQ